MSLRGIRTVYIIVAATVVTTLIASDDLVRILVAALIVIGAWPLWSLIRHCLQAEALEEAAMFLEALQHADEEDPPPALTLPALPAQTPNDSPR